MQTAKKALIKLGGCWDFAGCTAVCWFYHAVAQNHYFMYPFLSSFFSMKIEPPHDKTNKMTVRPAKTQISLGIHPVWSESSLSASRKLGSLATHWAHSEDSDQTGRCPGWSESLLGAQSFCWFWHETAQFISWGYWTTKRRKSIYN